MSYETASMCVPHDAERVHLPLLSALTAVCWCLSFFLLRCAASLCQMRARKMRLDMFTIKIDCSRMTFDVCITSNTAQHQNRQAEQRLNDIQTSSNLVPRHSHTARQMISLVFRKLPVNCCGNHFNEGKSICCSSPNWWNSHNDGDRPREVNVEAFDITLTLFLFYYIFWSQKHEKECEVAP